MSTSTRTLWTTTIGLKVVMAASGLGLVGFVVFHMLGHLQVLVGGRDAYNAYAHFMYGLGGYLWAARAGLLGLLAVHVLSALKLKQRNDAARPSRYAVKKDQATTVFAKTMLATGAGLLAFVVYHVAHFTLGLVHPEKFDVIDAEGRRDVFGNFVFSFQNPLIFVIYAVAVVLLCSHLAHACTSVFRTLGLMHGRFRPYMAKVGPALALFLVVGYLLPPLACLLRIVSP